MADFVTPLDYGATGDGEADDTDAVTEALGDAAYWGKWLDGCGGTFGVSGSIHIPDNGRIRKLPAKQLAPTTPNCRTLCKITGVGNIVLEDVTVDRGAQTAVGAPNDCAGIWLGVQTNIRLRRVGITGNGPGNGLVVAQCDGVVSIDDLHVRDMVFSAASDPEAEQLFAVRIIGAKDLELRSPRIENITSVIGGVARAFQTTGIAIDGDDWSIVGGSTRNCGQAIDGSGDGGNRGFLILAHRAIDIDSWGFKTGNDCHEGVISACLADRCGLGGFVAFGSNSSTGAINADLVYQACIARSTGANSNWAGANTAGFSVLRGDHSTDWPADILYQACMAVDRQATPTMKFGFRNELEPKAGHRSTVRAPNCTVVGATGTDFTGHFGDRPPFGHGAFGDGPFGR
jgi:hypothetical protein